MTRSILGLSIYKASELIYTLNFTRDVQTYFIHKELNGKSTMVYLGPVIYFLGGGDYDIILYRI